MKIKKIEVSDFRNLKPFSLDLGEGVNIFVGPNGQGKTNFLEAAYVAIHGKSFRQGQRGVFFPWSAIGSPRIKMELERPPLSYSVLFQLQREKKSIHLLNGKAASSAHIKNLFPTVLFSPESLNSIKGGPEERRTLVDDMMVGVFPKETALLSDYSKILRARNRVLRSVRDGEQPLQEAKKLLESLNQQFVSLGTELTLRRLLAINEILPYFRSSAQKILGNVEISVDYSISMRSAINWGAENVESFYWEKLKEKSEAEVSAGVSLVGPHKHDIGFLMNGQDSRFFCSQGQQRALILSYKIAQIMYHQRVNQVQPILLLDDVMSELDVMRQDFLLGYLKGLNSQILMTSTDLEASEGFNKPEIFHVEAGQVVRN